MSKKLKPIFLGSFTTLISKGIGLLCQIFTTGYLAQVFSSEQFGLWAIFLSFLMLSPCFDLGLGGAALRNQLIHLNHQKDRDNENKYYVSITTLLFILYVGIGLLSFIVFSLIPWGQIFHIHDPQLHKEIQSLLPWVSILLCLRIPFAMNADGFYAYHETHIRGILDGVESLLLSLFLILMIEMHVSFTAMVYLYFAGYLLTSIASFIFFLLRRHWKWVRVSVSEAFFIFYPKMKLGFFFWMQNLLSVLIISQLPTLISAIIDMKQLGEFSLIYRLSTLFLGIHFSMMNPLWSHYAQMAEEKDFLWIRKTFLWSLLIAVILCMGVVPFITFFHTPVIQIWAHQYVNEPYQGFYIGLWIFINIAVNSYTTLMNALSQAKLLFSIYLFALSLIGILVFLFHPYLTIERILCLYILVFSAVVLCLHFFGYRRVLIKEVNV
ncbi:MAG: hypothetical protein K9M07_02830 [Simkaniaceae bacterium]|nr:hypothetical protein [Simkaniaceae bacterium]